MRGLTQRAARRGLLLVAGLLVLVGCGGASGTLASKSGPADSPSQSAKMICAPEAQLEIATALGLRTTRPATPAYGNHLYSCRYVYRGSQIVVSVNELTDDKTTTGYFDSLERRLGKRGAIGGWGRRRSTPPTIRSSCVRTSRFSMSTCPACPCTSGDRSSPAPRPPC